MSDPVLEDAALYGLLGDIVRHLAPTTEAAPAGLLLDLMARFGSAIGSGLYLEHLGEQHPARVWPILVGDAAHGRKGTASGQIKTLFADAEPHWSKVCIGEGVKSAEVVIRLVDDRLGEDRRLFLMETEFQRMLATMAVRPNLSALLRSAWDARAKLVNTVKRPEDCMVATNPHITILGHATRNGLRQHLSDSDLQGGFASRFLYAHVNQSQLLGANFGVPQGNREEREVLVERLRNTLQGAFEWSMAETDPISAYLYKAFGWSPSRKLAVSKGFQDRWLKLYGTTEAPGELSSYPPGVVGFVCARQTSQVLRLAVIHAVANRATVVDVEHLDAALALWHYCRTSAVEIFGSWTGNRDLDDLLRALQSVTGLVGGLKLTMLRSEVSNLYGRNKSARQLDAIIAEGVDAGLVRVSTAKPKRGQTGRAATLVSYVEGK